MFVEKFIITEIAVQTARCCKIPISQLLGPSRERPVVRARWMAMYLARQMTDATLKEIAFVFRRDHASVEYALKQVRANQRLLEFCGFVRKRMEG